MHESEVRRENRLVRAELTGIDRVFYENLLGNRMFPQRNEGYLSFTLDALMSDSDPRATLRDYLFKPLDKDRVESLLKAATATHAAALPNGTHPVLDSKRIERLWNGERKLIREFLYEIIFNDALLRSQEERTQKLIEAIDTGEIPVKEVQLMSRAMKEYFSVPETVQQLKEYRRAFKDDDRANARRLGLIISRGCLNHALREIEKMRPDTNAGWKTKLWIENYLKETLRQLN